jgi:ribosome-binding protein aMBF1 (putative translation factor)
MKRGSVSLYPVHHDAHGRSYQRIVCIRCGAEGRNAFGITPASDDLAESFFARRGWVVDRRKGHVCPDCQKKETAARRQSVAERRVGMSADEKSAKAKAAIPAMYILLEDAYDRAAENYKPGWSDARVAKEVGLSEALVATRRAADFGGLTPPKPRLAEDVEAKASILLAQVDGVAAKLAEVTKSLSLLREQGEAIRMAAKMSAGK